MKALNIAGLVFVGAGFLWLYLAAFGLPLSPPTPPLLQRDGSGDGGGGDWRIGGCILIYDYRKRGAAEPLERHGELTNRLAARFPPGSSATVLEGVLLAQGFNRLSPCENDASIHRAIFHQYGGGLLVHPMTAVVAWKIKPSDEVEWAQGVIWLDGL